MGKINENVIKLLRLLLNFENKGNYEWKKREEKLIVVSRKNLAKLIEFGEDLIFCHEMGFYV